MRSYIFSISTFGTVKNSINFAKANQENNLFYSILLEIYLITGHLHNYLLA